MGWRQFANSIQSIVSNRHINRPLGLARHIQWQGRKLLNRFPYEQSISRSRIRATSASCGVSALVNSQGLYDYNNMSLLALLVRSGGTFFDVGANIGAYTLVASESQTAMVYAFEPHPRTFADLCGNIDLNHRVNVIAINRALSDTDGAAHLVDGPSSTNHIVKTSGTQRTIEIKTIRGDDFCTAKRVAPDYLKLDVEGFEYEVLAGFGAVLRRIKIIFVEINGLSDRPSRGAAAVDVPLAKRSFRRPFRC